MKQRLKQKFQHADTLELRDFILGRKQICHEFDRNVWPNSFIKFATGHRQTWLNYIWRTDVEKVETINRALRIVMNIFIARLEIYTKFWFISICERHRYMTALWKCETFLDFIYWILLGCKIRLASLNN